VALFGEAAEKKQKDNEGEKKDGSTATRRTVDLFSFRTDKTLTEALDALFSSPSSSIP
jgi:hypothetical protein